MMLVYIYHFIYDGCMENKKVNKKDVAYDVIRSRIIDGVYAPGQRIVIDQLAKELQLSIIPVREAIRQLEADGLVHNKQYSGPIVNTINEQEYLETLTVLAVLEGYATALSAANMTPDTIVHLKRLNHDMKTALEDFDFESFGDLNRKFHTLILDACGNAYLQDEIRRVGDRMDSVRRSVFTFLPVRAKHSVQEHDHLIDLFEKQVSFVVVEEAARDHKMNTARAFTMRERKKASDKESKKQ
jgi:DNA-binding GntR family transcriptional regulator